MTSKIRNRRNLVAVSALTGVAAIAGIWVLAAGGAGAAAPTSTAGATWTLPGGQLPGTALAFTRRSPRVEAAVQASRAISRRAIDPTSVREVIQGGLSRGGFGMRLLTARSTLGEPCISMVTSTGVARSFNCLDSKSGGGALVRYVMDGGTVIGNVEWVSLVGFARSDVARVTLVTQRGTEETLNLNRWRGFAYSTEDKDAFPASLRAYDGDGSLIEEMPTLP
ncbi:MAG: hypothetical protein ACRDJ2_13950 [Actinomycetota bacterium]